MSLNTDRNVAYHVVCENSYRDKSSEELRAMFAGRSGELGYDAWVRKFHDRKYDSGFSREMTRSVEEWLGEYGIHYSREQ